MVLISYPSNCTYFDNFCLCDTYEMHHNKKKIKTFQKIGCQFVNTFICPDNQDKKFILKTEEGKIGLQGEIFSALGFEEDQIGCIRRGRSKCRRGHTCRDTMV